MWWSGVLLLFVLCSAWPKSVSLEALKNGDAAAVSDFASSVLDFGVAVVRPSRSDETFFSNLSQQALSYLSHTSSDVKKARTMPLEGRDWGYVEVPQIKV